MRQLMVAIVGLSYLAVSAVQAVAGVADSTLPVPEPTTISLLSGGVALAIVGARWLKRK